MLNLKNNLRETEYQAQNTTQMNKPQIEAGIWVFETKAPLVPMYVGKMLGYGMCEVIYGKSLPFRVYKKRVATLRPLKPEELHLVNNPMGREIEFAAKSA
ncbi:hypothetical protein BKI52_34685 [marine bacterium AO1-C]|nr:hypothetical protein BKI52_34685 [marine bacterium AO1-C]